jgi:large subunit ribosomal protein L4
MLKIAVYNQEGKKVKEEDLNPKVFGLEVKPEFIHQVLTSILANNRHNYAHTKTKGEVRGGGKKPWKQKGTGRARAGSIRSPLWHGGGTVFGPLNERNYAQKINKRAKEAALRMSLSDKVKDNSIFVLDKISLAEIKTKIFFKILSNLIPDYKNKKAKAKRIVFSLLEKDLNIIKSARNIRNLKVIPATDLGLLECLKSDYLLLTLDGLKKIEKRLSVKEK